MKIIGKCLSFQSAVMFFWVFLFITIKLCCANNSGASSATHQAFPENEEGKSENWNWGNTGSVNHIEEEKFKSIKKPFNKKHLQPKPVILKKPFIKVPPRIRNLQKLSPEPSIPISEEKPLHMVKRPRFLIISFFGNLIPEFRRPILRPIPIVQKPISGYEKPTLKRLPCVKEKFMPFPKFRRPILRPIPIVQKPIPGYEKPISEPIPETRNPVLEFEKPISKPIPNDEKPISEPPPEFEKLISEPIPAAWKPIPEFGKPVLEPISSIEKLIPEYEKLSPRPTPLVRKPISNNEKPLLKSKKDLLLPQLASTIDPESLKLKKSLFKKPIPKIPFPPEFKKPLPVQKPIPPP